MYRENTINALVSNDLWLWKYSLPGMGGGEYGMLRVATMQVHTPVVAHAI